MSDPVLRLILGETPDLRLDKALARAAPEGAGLSRSRLVRLIEAGEVVREVGGGVATARTRPGPGEVWLVRLPAPDDIVARAENIPLDIVHEDDDLIVVNKPVGMVVHPAPGSETGTLVNALLHHCADSLSGIGGAKRPGIVHRIDKDTSGLLVVAKSDAAHQGLAAQFADHSIERHYRAIVSGVPSRADPRLGGVAGVAFESGNVIRVSGNIARHKTDRKKMAVVGNSGRHAITRFRVLEEFEQAAAVLDCWLETGRTHQIRVHLSHAGHSLIGDGVYGRGRLAAARSLPEHKRRLLKDFGRQALHAAVLGFVHPLTGRSVRFEADLPQDMTGLLLELRNQTPLK